MKNLILCIFLILAGRVLLAQRVESIHFVWGGNIENKPHGTLVISIGKYIKPTDRGLTDSIFGRCIVTDEATFDSLRNFIRQYGFTTTKITDVVDTVLHCPINGDSFYAIFGSDEHAVYLTGKYWASFFGQLKAFLRARALDQQVIAAF
jgi:hypothetical protein